jgi:soluble lytic murein transglycosylase-like protein
MTKLLLALAMLISFTASANDAKLVKMISNKYKVQGKMALEIVNGVNKVSKTHKVDKSLMLAIVSTESAFKPKARNKGCVGLMQVRTNSRLARKYLKGRNPYDVLTNLDLGALILKSCSKERNQIACYHGGVDRAYDRRVYSEQFLMKRFLKEN